MSFVTNMAALNTALVALGYTRTAHNLDIREKFIKNYYSIEVETELTDQTSNAGLTEDYVTLSIGYIVNSNSDFDSAVDSFRTVMEAIQDLSAYGGFDSRAEYRRLDFDNKKLIATVSFYLGRYGCT